MKATKRGSVYLKQVSRIKHRILADYLGPWTKVLGKNNKRLGYIDCFAGGGVYVDENNQPLPGSPVIALELAAEYAANWPDRSLKLGFVENDHATAERLRISLGKVTNIPQSVEYHVFEEHAQKYIEHIISSVKESNTGRVIPTFFFVDPYGHPISVPLMRQLLGLGKTEILVNLMWFGVSRNLRNSEVLDSLFGHAEWKKQSFTLLLGREKEMEFVKYFANEVGASYSLQFPVPFSPEDRVQGGKHRTKFYLIHFSNHPKAALIMKQVMWKAKQDLKRIQLGPQLMLFENEPSLTELGERLSEQFSGRELSFDEILIQTLEWPGTEGQYRKAIQSMEGTKVAIHRLESKKTGLKGRDRVSFP